MRISVFQDYGPVSYRPPILLKNMFEVKNPIKIFILLAGMLVSLTMHAQSTNVPMNEDYLHLIDRYEISSGTLAPQLFTAVKPYYREAIVSFVDSLSDAAVFVSDADRFNETYLRNDNWEWAHPETNQSEKPVFNFFYKNKTDLFNIDEPDFDLHVNPVLYLGGGNDSRLSDALFINTRGAEVRGTIDHKIGFYTYLTDNQAILPSYVTDGMVEHPVIPHEGFWKEFKDGRGVDFLQARGYISFQATRHVNIQFGHDQLFIGNGFRSLIRSDFAPPSLFLKANATIWKLNYLFVLNRMVADVQSTTSGLTANSQYPDKYSALHHLSINIGKKFNLGLFESVVFTPSDTTGHHFDWSYLNPVIFYRAIEQQYGSSDNVILGMDFKWLVTKGVSFYGQFVLDEFVLDHIKAADGWWANKFGFQAGLKYINAFGVSNLDLQGEVNVVRPYTYSHNTMYGSYSSYQQSLAHPLGSNFKEVIGIARYQPLPKLNITGKLIYSEKGQDGSGANWGGDILKRNGSREQEFDNTIAQGVNTRIMFASLTASWQLKHNLFVDGNLIIRKSESPAAQYNNTSTISSLVLRWNIARRLYEF